jgi:hypothetical protein
MRPSSRTMTDPACTGRPRGCLASANRRPAAPTVPGPGSSSSARVSRACTTSGGNPTGDVWGTAHTESVDSMGRWSPAWRNWQRTSLVMKGLGVRVPPPAQTPRSETCSVLSGQRFSRKTPVFRSTITRPPTPLHPTSQRMAVTRVITLREPRHTRGDVPSAAPALGAPRWRTTCRGRGSTGRRLSTPWRQQATHDAPSLTYEGGV